jgi:hypothetical protein
MVKSDDAAIMDGQPAKPVLIAQACGTCGAELSSAAVLGGISASKRKSEALITDSLWGNLILDMAYQRDPDLSKLMKKMNYMNYGTMGAISGIAAGTLAQGIIALTTLNPPAGIEDSYVPGGIGVGLSAATIATFAARMYFGHRFQVEVRNKQLQIKDRVENVLTHLEHSNCDCEDAKKELIGLVGSRASNEWLQLWRSSHKLASNGSTPITSNGRPNEIATSSKKSDDNIVAGQAGNISRNALESSSDNVAEVATGKQIRHSAKINTDQASGHKAQKAAEHLFGNERGLAHERTKPGVLTRMIQGSESRASAAALMASTKMPEDN